MDRTNAIGLDKAKTEELAKGLNDLLANYSVFYQNTRGYHWNVKGEQFFVLHEKFEELYNDQKLKIDEIAERILTLRYQPTSNMSEYLKDSNLKESPSDISDSKMIEILLEDHGLLLKQMRKVVEIADKSGDEGTIDLIGAYIRELEKTSWMLDAWKMKTSDQHKPVKK